MPFPLFRSVRVPSVALLASVAGACFPGAPGVARLLAESPPASAGLSAQEAFFARCDMLWTKVPKSWDAAPFLGDGMVGAIVRQSDERTLSWEVGRADNEDHQGAKGDVVNSLYYRCRLAPGAMKLKTKGKITGCDWRLDLLKAELRGVLKTSEGEIRLRSYVPARGPGVIIVEIEPSSGEKDCAWEWEAFPAVSPRALMKGETGAKKPKEAPDYRPDPSPTESRRGDIDVCVQKLGDGSSCVARRESRSGAVRRLVVGVAHTPEGDAGDAAVAAVESAGPSAEAGLTKAHRDWWSAWYAKTSLAVTDNYWTAFYWAQMYKFASATRPDGVVLDLQGPWAQRVTPWPGTWTNLNIQLTYWPCYVGNRLDLADSLRLNLRKYRENLILNAPAKYRADSAGIGRASALDLRRPVMEPGVDREAEIGSLPWICHNLWWHYRVTMDDAMLREDVYPLLRRAVNYYLHFAKEGADGRIHLPETYSPEYGSSPDCNYDLALFKWGCRTLLWIDARLKLNDPLAPKWRDVDRRLVDFPTDAHGLMIGAKLPLKSSHRHYSHLFSIWPLRLLDADKPETRELATKSVRWWHSLKGGLQGYSYTGGASLLATIGDADGAYDMLQGLKRFVRPSTMYRESGPVIETPLSAAQSMHDLLLQSVGDEIRVFSATPSAWPDASFRDLRGEGAFLVSAERRDGETRLIRVESLAGEPLRLRAKFPAAPVVEGVSADAVRTVPGGWDVTLPKGGVVTFRAPGASAAIRDVAGTGPTNPFGLR